MSVNDEMREKGRGAERRTKMIAVHAVPLSEFRGEERCDEAGDAECEDRVGDQRRSARRDVELDREAEEKLEEPLAPTGFPLCVAFV